MFISSDITQFIAHVYIYIYIYVCVCIYSTKEFFLKIYCGWTIIQFALSGTGQLVITNIFMFHDLTLYHHIQRLTMVNISMRSSGMSGVFSFMFSIWKFWKEIMCRLYEYWQQMPHHYIDIRTLHLYSWHQAPVPLSILRSNSKFDENSKHSSVKYTRPITTIFCTRHDSVTVVTCAKYRCDRSSVLETRAFWIFIEFRIRSKYA